MNHTDKIRRARTLLVMDHPFFGALALRLDPIPDKGLKTMSTNGRDLRYNPDFVMAQSDLHLKAMLAHEVMHVANGHTWRRGERDKEMWNKAGDYAINHLLLSAGLSLPPGALMDTSYGTSAEQVYAKLQQQQAIPQQQGNQGQPQQGQGQQSPDGGVPSPGDQPSEGDQQGQPNPDKGSKGKGKPGKGQNQPEDGSNGDQPDDNPQDGQQDDDGGTGEPVPDPGGCGAVEDAPPDECKEQEEEWRVAVAQAAQAARSQGNMPAGLERMVHTIVSPKVPWTVLLRDFVERAARNDYNWTRPSNRFAGRGVILPTLISEEIPEMVLAVDTSGSIGNDTLAQFASEASAILGAYETRIHVVYCDARVQGTEEYTRADLPLHLENKGGGGTDFRPVFDWVEQQGLTPTCLIYLTDLYGTFPKSEPTYPTLWVTVDEGNRKAVPFGDVAVLEN